MNKKDAAAVTTVVPEVVLWCRLSLFTPAKRTCTHLFPVTELVVGQVQLDHVGTEHGHLCPAAGLGDPTVIEHQHTGQVQPICSHDTGRNIALITPGGPDSLRRTARPPGLSNGITNLTHGLMWEQVYCSWVTGDFKQKKKCEKVCHCWLHESK